MSNIQIEGRNIGFGERTFVIAEVGINHDGDMEKAVELIQQAKQSGADAVKLQTYITEQRVAKDSPIFDILKKCELTFKQQEELFKLGRECGITIFSTPFDRDSVGFLESIDSPIYKIASFDSVNRELLRAVSLTGKPMIMSTGMTSKQEFLDALSLIGGNPLAVLHCISSYPMPPEAANLSAIKTLKSLFDGPVGYSDHSIGCEIPAFAVAVGACIIEKHFTLDSGAEGPDHALSADPQVLAEMIAKIRFVESLIGAGEMGVREAEKDIVQYRRQSN